MDVKKSMRSEPALAPVLERLIYCLPATSG